MKSRKKFLIPLILAVIFLAVGAAGGIYINSRRTNNAPPDHYFARSEQISSMTDIVGERSLAEAVPEPVPSDAETVPAASDAAVSESAASLEGEENEAQIEADSPSGADSPEAKVYRYYSSENARQDVDSYIEYLKTEKHFIDVTDAQKEDAEDKAAASEAGSASSTGSAQDGAGAESRKKVHRLAGASQDSDSYLSITITEEADGYTVTTVKENQPWAAYFTQLWDSALHQAGTDNTEPQPSLASAEETVRTADQQLLGLPAPASEYEFIAKRGLVRLNGNDYYCVSAYRANDTETFDYEGAYLLDASSGKIMYRYDEATGDAQLLR